MRWPQHDLLEQATTGSTGHRFFLSENLAAGNAAENGDSDKDLVVNDTGNIRKSEVAASVSVGELFVIESKQG